MISYLLESSICLAAFYGLYWLALSKTKLLNINRIYLLTTALLSLLIPLIEIPVSSQEIGFSTGSTEGAPTVVTQIVNGADGYQINAWLVFYCIGLTVFLISLLKSVSGLLRLIKKPREKSGGYWLVQTEDKEISSFLNYIFLPAEFELRSTEAQVCLAHEEVHLRQFHSIDLMFMQLLRLLFWFNPFVHAYKRALKLQHEYIADHLTAENTGKTTYSNVLIRHALQGVSIPLVHSYAEHPVEKRLEMIDKQNPTTMKKLKPLFALPVIIGLIMAFGLSNTTHAQNAVDDVKSNVVDAMKKTTDSEAPKRIKGKVQDGKTGLALEKVAVFGFPSNTGTYTNTEGKYLIEIAKTDTLIVFRKPGFDDIKVPRKRQSVINVALPEKGLAKNNNGN